MTIFNTDQVLDKIQDAIERDDIQRAIQILESLRPADQGDVFDELEDKDKLSLLPQLAPGDAADILEYLDDQQAAELVEALPTDNAIRIIDEMEPDEAADVLGDLEAGKAQEILEHLDHPEEVRPLMLHSDETAGGLMTSEYLALRRRMSVADATQAIREWQPDAEMAYYLYVVDGQGVLCGIVSMRQLITADPATKLQEIMDPDVISVPSDADQEATANLLARYSLLALPVVDSDHRLVGVIAVDDVIDVMVEEATEDIQRMGGAEPLTEPYLNSTALEVVRKRIGWLLLLFITESLTGTVLRHFEGELQSVVALSFFIPLLIGTGGNAGSQTTSTIIRALALGEINLGDALKSLWHETRIGLVMGLGMSVVAYIRAITWGSTPGLALTVSLAILTIVVWANSLGAILPLLASRLKIDPTVVSGPVMSTLVDATGLFIYFTIARFVMGL